MVEATVTNDPVSIVLDGGQSTTVPSNETWRVSIHMMNQDVTKMTIDGIGSFAAEQTRGGAQGNYLDVTLIGGQSIAEVSNGTNAGVFITGFVVNR
jgi:hypothetical protein